MGYRVKLCPSKENSGAWGEVAANPAHTHKHSRPEAGGSGCWLARRAKIKSSRLNERSHKISSGCGGDGSAAEVRTAQLKDQIPRTHTNTGGHGGPPLIPVSRFCFKRNRQKADGRRYPTSTLGFYMHTCVHTHMYTPQHKHAYILMYTSTQMHERGHR